MSSFAIEFRAIALLCRAGYHLAQSDYTDSNEKNFLYSDFKHNIYRNYTAKIAIES
jgi:hypothetical protein